MGRLLALGLSALLALGARAGAQDGVDWTTVDPGVLNGRLRDGELSEVELEEAERQFERLEEREPARANFFLYRILRARSEARAGSPDELPLLERAIERALAVDPTRPPNGGLARMAHRWMQLHRGRLPPRELEGFLRRMVGAIQPHAVERPPLVYALVDQVQSQGRYEEALTLLDAAEAEMADHAPADGRERAFWEQSSVALGGMRGLVELRLGVPDRAADRIRTAFEHESRLAEVGGDVNPGYLIAAYQNLSAFWKAVDRDAEALARLDDLLGREELFAVHPALRPQVWMDVADAHLELRFEGEEHLGAAGEWLAEALAHPELRGVERLRAHALSANLALVEERTNDAAFHLEAARVILDATGEAAGRATHPRDLAKVVALELRLARLEERVEDVGGLVVELRDALERVREEWLALPELPGGIGPLRYSDDLLALGELVRGTAELEGAAAGLGVLARMQGTGGVARALGRGEASAREIAEALVPDGGGLLIVFPQKDVLLAFEVDTEGVRFRSAPTDADLRRVARRFGRALSENPSRLSRSQGDRRRETLRDDGALLARILLDGLPPWRRVAIVGQGLLGDLPFEALPAPEGGYFGLARALSYAPSLPGGVALAERPARVHAQDLVLLTNAELSSAARALLGDAAPVAMSAAEVRRLVAGFGEVATLLGEGATLAAFAEAGPATVQHVFAHGVHDYDEPVPAGLALTAAGGGDGIARRADVLSLELGELVVFAACGSGAGPERYGDPGSAHLGGAALIAGARTVVLPHATVDQRATYELGVAAHAGLLDGLAVDDAVRRARVEAVEAGYDDPYFWAQMHVLGVAGDPLFAPVEEGGAGGPSSCWRSSLAPVAIAAWARRRRAGER